VNILILAGAVLTALIAAFWLVRLLAVAFGKQQFAGEWGAVTVIVIITASAAVSYWLTTLL
jgi:hypothetical protein